MSLRQSEEIIPDMVRFGAFPFEINEQLDSVMNLSGTSGPIIAPIYVPNTPGQLATFSGILGPGTFYPISGSLDTFMRMFWGVRSWTLSVRVQVKGLAVPQLPPSPPGVPDACSSVRGIPTNYIIDDSITRTLATEDLFNTNDVAGEYTIKPDSYFTDSPLIQPCVPLDPIQKWGDLMCRKDYFTWTPKNSILESFRDGTSTLDRTGDLASFYVSELPDVTFPGYNDNGGRCRIRAPKNYSFFSLSIMNRDFLSQSGLIPILDNQDERFNKYVSFVDGEKQPINPDKDSYNNYFGNVWESGTPLTDEWGQIVEYGEPFKTSKYTPNMFHKAYIDPMDVNYLGEGDYYIPEVNPASQQGYFPLFNFVYRMRAESLDHLNLSSYNIFPAMSVFVSSRLPYQNARRVGTLTIAETSNLTNDNLGLSTSRKIAVIDLFGEALGSTSCTVTATLTPNRTWISKANLDTQILN